MGRIEQEQEKGKGNTKEVPRPPITHACWMIYTHYMHTPTHTRPLAVTISVSERTDWTGLRLSQSFSRTAQIYFTFADIRMMMMITSPFPDPWKGPRVDAACSCVLQLSPCSTRDRFLDLLLLAM